MKGIVVSSFGQPEVLEYTDCADPLVEPRQVLIEVRAASVNFADIKARSGAYHLGRKPPFVPGLDVAGVVIGTGTEVSDLQPGDHVVAFPASGSYAEKAVADRALTFVIPDHIAFVDAAAAALVSGTATLMLEHIAGIREGESVLVHGAGGGVGTMALQVARACGASLLVGTIGSLWKEEQVREAGADEVVDYRSAQYADEVKAMTGGGGVDIILNPFGGITIERDLQCLAPFGRLVVFGEMRGEPARIPANGLYTASRSVRGCSFGHYRKSRPQRAREVMERAIDLLSSGAIAVYVDRCFVLQEAALAHQFLEERKAVGKIVLVPEKQMT